MAVQIHVLDCEDFQIHKLHQPVILTLAVLLLFNQPSDVASDWVQSPKLKHLPLPSPNQQFQEWRKTQPTFHVITQNKQQFQCVDAVGLSLLPRKIVRPN